MFDHTGNSKLHVNIKVHLKYHNLIIYMPLSVISTCIFAAQQTRFGFEWRRCEDSRWHERRSTWSAISQAEFEVNMLLMVT